ncbi:MAG TPA: HAMP domain-containing sensor histidine kinase [Bacteroidales bacterium]|nr:HAMP domain-containing sensor histidine kinase [Bacteroidales bacterium]
MHVNNILYLKANLNKVARILFPLYGILSLTGFTSDIINFYETSPRILILNLTTICLTLLGLSLYYFKTLRLKSAFALLIYISIGNVITDTLTDPFGQERVLFFLRDSLFVFFILTLAALFINKNQAILIVSVHLLTTVLLTVISGNSFLSSSLIIMCIFFIAYTAVIYYAVSVMESSILDRENILRTIENDNMVMNDINTQLEERQQQIEQQSVRLEAQAEVLKKQSKELSESNLELERINKTKDLFLSILAHDLKNSFHLIMNYSELLENRHESLDNLTRSKFVSIISATSVKASGLLEKLLQWAQSQSNTLDFNPAKIAMDNIIRENLILFAESFQKKGIQVTQNLLEGCNINADENMMNTVVRNLLSNAGKFTPDGGKIDVNCRKVNGHVLVEVSDSGIGMDKTSLGNLFRIDKKRSTSGTSGETGSGLGLLLCKVFVEKNGGQIRVTSELNKGSVFSFSLPAV